MRDDAFWQTAGRLLACPHCGGALSPGHEFGPGPGMLRCERGHSFDIARPGYVNLLPGDARPGTADTAEMVSAREAVLGAGLFDELIAAVAAAAAEGAAGTGGCVVDAGAGTGHYLSAVLSALPGRTGVALDISKYAARRAASLLPDAVVAVCDTWQALPMASSVAGVIISAFAPRNPGEFARVLEAGGAAIVVTPTARHLAEIVEPLGLVTVEREKSERVGRSFETHLVSAGVVPVEIRLSLSRDEVVALARMGPSARHREKSDTEARAHRLDEPVGATVSVSIETWRLGSE